MSEPRVVEMYEPLLRARHDAAHNGDIVEMGTFDRCSICQPALAEFRAEAAALDPDLLRAAIPDDFSPFWVEEPSDEPFVNVRFDRDAFAAAILAEYVRLRSIEGGESAGSEP